MPTPRMLIRTLQPLTLKMLLLFDPQPVFVFGDGVYGVAFVALPGDGAGDWLFGVQFGGCGGHGGGDGYLVGEVGGEVVVRKMCGGPGEVLRMGFHIGKLGGVPVNKTKRVDDFAVCWWTVVLLIVALVVNGLLDTQDIKTTRVVHPKI